MNAEIIDLSAREPDGCPLGAVRRRADSSSMRSTNTASDCRCRAGHIAEAAPRAWRDACPSATGAFRSIVRPCSEMPDAGRLGGAQLRTQPERPPGRRRGLWLVGDIGTGKTTLAMIASGAALQAGRTVAIYSLPRLLNLIREEIGTENGMLDLLDRLSSVDLLHIDDLGAQNTTEWGLEQLYSIVNTRYEAERAMIVTTNLMPDKLAEQLGRANRVPAGEMCGDLCRCSGRTSEALRRALPPAIPRLARSHAGTGWPAPSP